MILAAAVFPNPTDVTADGHWRPSAYDAAFTALRAAGYRHFELSRTRRLTVATAEAIRKRAARMGLTPVALHAPSLHGPDEIERQLAIAAAAHALGAPIVVLHVSSIRQEHWDYDIRHVAWERDRQRIRALGPFLAERGMKLALENSSRPQQWSYLQSQIEQAEEVGISNVGIALDTGHANMRTEFAHEVAAEVAPQVVHTHIHDNNRWRDEHLPPGRGYINWPRLASALFAVNYAGAWCLELKAHPSRDLEAKLNEGRRFLERLFSLA